MEAPRRVDTSIIRTRANSAGYAGVRAKTINGSNAIAPTAAFVFAEHTGPRHAIIDTDSGAIRIRLAGILITHATSIHLGGERRWLPSRESIGREVLLPHENTHRDTEEQSAHGERSSRWRNHRCVV